MVKVVIDREGCVSCGSCYDICPEVFEENEEDTFSEIKEEYRIAGNLAEGEVPDDLAECVSDAADACPSEVIEIG